MLVFNGLLIGSHTLLLQAEDPREKMLRKRPAGTESQQKAGTASNSGTTSTGAPPPAKKYKDFKF